MIKKKEKTCWSSSLKRINNNVSLYDENVSLMQYDHYLEIQEIVMLMIKIGLIFP